MRKRKINSTINEQNHPIGIIVLDATEHETTNSKGRVNVGLMHSFEIQRSAGVARSVEF